MRADVTDMPGYWDSVVDSPPERREWYEDLSSFSCVPLISFQAKAAWPRETVGWSLYGLAEEDKHNRIRQFRLSQLPLAGQMEHLPCRYELRRPSCIRSQPRRHTPRQSPVQLPLRILPPRNYCPASRPGRILVCERRCGCKRDAHGGGHG